MKWLSMALFALTKLPVEKFIVRRRDPVEQVNRLEALFAKDTEIGRQLTGQAPESPTLETPTPVIEPRGERVTTEETVDYQKRELGKELLLLEKHLQQKCKILNKACDCCEKHPIVIEALAQETLGITGDPLYGNVAAWAKKIAPITTEDASRSGQYEEEYPRVATEARKWRKRLMGTTDLKVLLSPQYSEKVSAELQEIMDRALKKEGGNDDTGKQ